MHILLNTPIQTGACVPPHRLRIPRHPFVPPYIVPMQHHLHLRPHATFPLGRLSVLMYPPLPFRRIFLLVSFHSQFTIDLAPIRVFFPTFPVVWSLLSHGAMRSLFCALSFQFLCRFFFRCLPLACPQPLTGSISLPDDACSYRSPFFNPCPQAMSDDVPQPAASSSSYAPAPSSYTKTSSVPLPFFLISSGLSSLYISDLFLCAFLLGHPGRSFASVPHVRPCLSVFRIPHALHRAYGKPWRYSMVTTPTYIPLPESSDDP